MTTSAPPFKRPDWAPYTGVTYFELFREFSIAPGHPGDAFLCEGNEQYRSAHFWLGDGKAPPPDWTGTEEVT